MFTLFLAAALVCLGGDRADPHGENPNPDPVVQRSRADLQQDVQQAQAALRSFDQSQGSTQSGASPECYEQLNTLQKGIAILATESKKGTAGMLAKLADSSGTVTQQVAATQDAVISSQLHQTAVVSDQISQAQQQSATAAENARQAQQAINDNSHRNLAAELLGFLTVLATLIVREMCARQERRDQAKQLRTLQAAVLTKQGDQPHESESHT